MASFLEFPESPVNTVVPERHSRGRVTVRQAHGLSKVEGRESIGAKGQWCALVKDISYCKANRLQAFLTENSGNFCLIPIDNRRPSG